MNPYELLVKRAENIAARNKPFATNVRPKALPGEPGFIGPVERIGPPERIGPQLPPRAGDPTFVGPSEFVGPQRPVTPEFIGPPEMQGPQQAFRTIARAKPRPGEPGFVGPVEQMGPQIPRAGEPGFVGPIDQMGPRQLPRSTDPNFVGPREQIGPQFPRSGEPGFVGPMEQIGPQQLPRPTDPRFIGPREQIGPSAPALAAVERMSVGSPYAGSYLPLFAGGTLAGTALLSGGQQAQDQGRMDRFAQIYGGNATSSPYSLQEANQQAAINAVRGRPEFEQGPVGSGHGAAPPSMDKYLADRAKAIEANAALDVARARTAAPMPPSRELQAQARAEQPSPSILSRIFSGQDYQSSGPAGGDTRLYQGEKDGRKVINWGNPESAADFFRASKAQQDWNAQNPDSPSIGAGMKRGGAANAKPDSLHKALEIIHHLLTRGH